MNMRRKTGAAERGVSLVEALVAMAIMAIGMLGLVGMQAGLRANSDISKQRAEAVRLAQEAIEEWRTVTSLTAAGGSWSYERLVDQADAPITNTNTNATYTRTRTVHDMDTTSGIGVADAVPRAKSVTVKVSWFDRTDIEQSVTLTSVIGGFTPDLAATMSVPGDGDPVRMPFGRNRGIPVQAVDLGDGRSGFVPPGAPTGVAWVFSNTTSIITLCTLVDPSLAVNSPNNLSCGSTKALLLSGVIRCSLAATPDSVNPVSNQPAALSGLEMYVNETAPFASTAPGLACYMDNSVASRAYTPYYCAARILATGPTVDVGWTGSLIAEPQGTFIGYGADKFKLCRYVAAASYTDVRVALTNQNMLVIPAGTVAPGNSCPSTGLPTWPHQPSS